MPNEVAQAELAAGLDELDEFLEQPANKKPNFKNMRLTYWGMVGCSPADLPRAQGLYQRVFEAGGTGSTYVQEALLNTIALTNEPSSIPFWLHLLNLTKPRDSFARKRQTFALSALAFLAIQRKGPAAYDALRQAAHHPNPEVRALGVYYWGRAYQAAGHPIPPDVLADLTNIATNNPAFGPRFQARSILRQAGRPAPLDNPGGVFAFKVRLVYLKGMYRTIEVRSEQTLDDLHYAIQRAIKWDADHLYSFFMNGVQGDERYAFACPYEEDRPPWTHEAVIGELGLTLKHKFLYYFDYGDSHEFEVKAVAIRPQAEPGNYPRVVDSQGKAPGQYQ